jgi:hypothetical protein
MNKAMFNQNIHLRIVMFSVMADLLSRDYPISTILCLNIHIRHYNDARLRLLFLLWNAVEIILPVIYGWYTW